MKLKNIYLRGDLLKGRGMEVVEFFVDVMAYKGNNIRGDILVPYNYFKPQLLPKCMYQARKVSGHVYVI
jgi:hypothetical protein